MLARNLLPSPSPYCAFTEARDIYKFDGGRDDLVCFAISPEVPIERPHLTTPIGIDRAKRIVCRLRLARARQGVKECALPTLGRPTIPA